MTDPDDDIAAGLRASADPIESRGIERSRYRGVVSEVL
jgi:tRNA U34 5-carboxymethylaminomethyl modifying GTPase MnmE/TrmE